MKHLSKPVTLCKDYPQPARYQALLKDGPCMVKITRWSYQDLTLAITRAIRDFGMTLDSVCSL